MGRECIHYEESVSTLTEWLVENIASTIVGNKPSTILTLADTRTFPFLTIWRRSGSTILSGMIIKYKTLNSSRNKETVLFYRTDILLRCLHHAAHREFLQDQGYPIDRGIHACLEVLKQRFECCCPHEIGVLLGIPLKDVLGFMRLNNLPLTCRHHWCVYGNPEESLTIMNQYLEDHSYVCNLMTKGLQPQRILSGEWKEYSLSAIAAS
jgi:hypothetical protein